MPPSSSQSVGFTLAIISPTGFSSVTLIEFRGKGLKKKKCWWKNVANADLYAHTCSVLITCKESFGLVIILPSSCQEFKSSKSIQMLRKSISGTKLCNFFA